MNLDEYVVLRIPERTKKAMASYEKKAEAPVTRAGKIIDDSKIVIPDVKKMDSAGQEVELHSAELDKREISALKKEYETVTAGVMPMSLHKPTSENDIETNHAGKTSWGLEAIGIPYSPYKGKGITVAVLDTGIDSSHPAFENVELLEKDFTGQGNGDDHGHGTHVAGTLFGQHVDGYSIGVAPGIKKGLIGKVLDATGGGSTKQISEGILWAISEGANIITMSLGIDFPEMRERFERDGLPSKVATSKALERYRENIFLFTRIAETAAAWASEGQPVILIAASGNDSRRDLNSKHEISATPPAAAGDIKAIGAVGQSDDGSLFTAPFSNTNVELTGPGMGIISAKSGGGYKQMDGTSMAAPHVAGVLALWGEKILLGQDTFDAENIWMNTKFHASRKKIRPPYDILDVGKGLVMAPQD